MCSPVPVFWEQRAILVYSEIRAAQGELSPCVFLLALLRAAGHSGHPACVRPGAAGPGDSEAPGLDQNPGSDAAEPLVGSASKGIYPSL